ncbi:MAG: RluA family pseudouridine synthase [Kiritimatiellaeota bacterium]|nr:RluA family pseudouridine synthase [Kiritimatiellota bacterium]
MTDGIRTKKRPRRHIIRGVDILHEDYDILVVYKDIGVLSTALRNPREYSAEGALTNYLRKGDTRSRKCAYPVHRLDRETSGVMIFAKTQEAQNTLKDNWKGNEKIYFAAVRGKLAEKCGTLTSYLAEDEDLFMRSVDNPQDGKLSQTAYEVVAETPTMSLLKINLLTGRKNQIRVQFAEAGHPVVGDPKYGRNDPFRERLCLHAKSIAFDHPHHGKRMFFDTELPSVFLRLFPEYQP